MNQNFFQMLSFNCFIKFALIGFPLLLMSCQSSAPSMTQEQLLRIPYTSSSDNANREYFVYLPKGYGDDPNQKWPVMMFLHGDGERGNGLDELEFVLIHGPLYEAWIQKRDLPFVIISPQLHMFGRDTLGVDYLTDRDISTIPERSLTEIPQRDPEWKSTDPINGEEQIVDESEYYHPPSGWDQVEEDLMGMLDHVNRTYNTDIKRQYLTGLSYGGFGTWYMASKHPDTFAAISPVVGWGHPDLMEPIAAAKLPIWVFAGGRDATVAPQYFYYGLNKLESLGHTNFYFTNHEDGGHDVWRRIYAGQDLYDWFLKQSK